MCSTRNAQWYPSKWKDINEDEVSLNKFPERQISVQSKKILILCDSVYIIPGIKDSSQKHKDGQKEKSLNCFQWIFLKWEVNNVTCKVENMRYEKYGKWKVGSGKHQDFNRKFEV